MIRAGIVGGTGYTGVELLRILALHNEVDVAVVTSRSDDGMRVDTLYPSLRGNIDVCFSKPDVESLASCDVVFFATPNGTAMLMAEQLLARDVKVIDLPYTGIVHPVFLTFLLWQRLLLSMID